MSPRFCVALGARDPLAHRGARDCDGRLTRHHLIPQRVLKDQFPEGALVIAGYGAIRLLRKDAHAWHIAELPFDLDLERGTRLTIHQRSLTSILRDMRNQVWVCATHHERVENARIEIPPIAFPPELHAFADELGMGSYLERFYPVAA